MDLDDALQILGLDRSSSPREQRSRYRELLHAIHPDHGGSGDDTRSLIAAYEVLAAAAASDVALDAAPSSDSSGSSGSSGQHTDDEPISPPSADGGSAETRAWQLEPDTLALACPSDEAYTALLAVAHRIGDVTYVDRHNELFETLLRTTEGDTLSFVCTLQGRANGTTEAFFTVETLDVARGALPPIEVLTALVLSELLGPD
jgi:hypothetical protein